jgi:hypothetical protein
MNTDHLVRVSASELEHLRLEHLESGIDSPDDDFATPAALLGAEPTEFTGYTEWVGAVDAGVSVGWDWVVNARLSLLTLRPGTIRTTLMLVDEHGAPLGHDATAQCLHDHLTRWAWQSKVLEALDSRAGPGHVA